MAADTRGEIDAGSGIGAGSAGADPPLLEVEHLRTSFLTRAGPVHAVDGVDLSLDHARTLGIVGESGSGKSVLCRSIMGLLSRGGVERSGRIALEGEDLLGLSTRAMRRKMGAEIAMVFQDPMTALHPLMRVGDQVAEGLRIHRGLSRSDARDLALELLRSVHISEPQRRLRQYPHELSGGMRQRLVIAIAISCGPKLLLADEPTTALDVTVQQQILDLLDEKQRAARMGLILVSHDLGVVATRTDEIAVMYAGRIVEIGPTAELFAHARMRYTEALLRSTPRVDAPSHTRLATIPGQPPKLLSPPPGCRFAPRCEHRQERCTREEPTLVEADVPGHRFACWYPATPTRVAAHRAGRPEVRPPAPVSAV